MKRILFSVLAFSASPNLVKASAPMPFSAAAAAAATTTIPMPAGDYIPMLLAPQAATAASMPVTLLPAMHEAPFSMPATTISSSWTGGSTVVFYRVPIFPSMPAAARPMPPVYSQLPQAAAAAAASVPTMLLSPDYGTAAAGVPLPPYYGAAGAAAERPMPPVLEPEPMPPAPQAAAATAAGGGSSSSAVTSMPIGRTASTETAAYVLLTIKSKTTSDEEAATGDRTGTTHAGVKRKYSPSKDVHSDGARNVLRQRFVEETAGGGGGGVGGGSSGSAAAPTERELRALRRKDPKPSTYTKGSDEWERVKDIISKGGEYKSTAACFTRFFTGELQYETDASNKVFSTYKTLFMDNVNKAKNSKMYKYLCGGTPAKERKGNSFASHYATLIMAQTLNPDHKDNIKFLFSLLSDKDGKENYIYFFKKLNEEIEAAGGAGAGAAWWRSGAEHHSEEDYDDAASATESESDA